MMHLISRRAIVGATVLSLLAPLAWAGFLDREVSFSEAEVQAALDRKGTLQRSYGGVVTVALKQAPKIALGVPEGQVGVTGRVDVITVFTPHPIPVDIVAHAGVRYDDTQKAFFLEKPVVDSLSAPGLPRETEPVARDAVTALVAQYLRNQPVHVLREDGSAEERAARWLLKAVRVEPGKVVATLSPF